MRTMLTLITAAFSVLALAAPVGASASANQVGGEAVPWPVAPDTCDPGAFGPVDYILAMPEGSGDLTGCVYGVRGEATQRPGGTINVLSQEIFAGCLGAVCGTFELDARITSKWDGPPGPPPADQKFGRCQHKIVSGSGTGGFEGIEGRLDFKDIIQRDANGVVTGVVFDYRGHLK